MRKNQVIDAIVSRKSIRTYTDQTPSDEVIETIVRAGQQAPFAYQLGSLLLSRDRDENPFGAPLLFTVCVDVHRLELVMARRGWRIVTNDLSLLLFGIQDSALMAENMVIAAESLGLGSCFIGAAPYRAEEIIERYDLPRRVFPLVQLAMGYPAENPPPRPRYPMSFALFEDEYPRFSEEEIRQAIMEMDEGYLAQDYYRKAGYMVPLEEEREETYTFEDYGWTEHISRKAGQWHPSPRELVEQLDACGFDLSETTRMEDEQLRDD
jgi:nitroreductase